MLGCNSNGFESNPKVDDDEPDVDRDLEAANEVIIDDKIERNSNDVALLSEIKSVMQRLLSTALQNTQTKRTLNNVITVDLLANHDVKGQGMISTMSSRKGKVITLDNKVVKNDKTDGKTDVKDKIKAFEAKKVQRSKIYVSPNKMKLKTVSTKIKEKHERLIAKKDKIDDMVKDKSKIKRIIYYSTLPHESKLTR